MRILAWNIRGGGREGIADAVKAIAPDVAVLSDCRPSHHIGLVALLRESGFEWVVGTNRADVTGLLIASRTPLQPGPTSSRVLPAHWCHVWLPDRHLSLVGIYGPLRGMAPVNPVQPFWAELAEAAEGLRGGAAILIGDLNTAAAPRDKTTEGALPAAKNLRRLLDDGWRDAFREANGDQMAYSYRDGRGEYRIDHALLSPSAPTTQRAEYIDAIAGLSLSGWPRSLAAPALSDHAALVIDV